MTLHTIYLSLGSNLGDRHTNCERALESLRASHDFQIMRVSPWYRSRAITMGNVSQADYCNGVASASTTRSPRGCLELLLQTEKRLGRVRSGKRWEARTIDLDLIFYDNAIIEESDLIVPHPELTKRLFVLQPLCDIAPLARHPILKQTIYELMVSVRTSEESTMLRLWHEDEKKGK